MQRARNWRASSMLHDRY